MANPKDNPSWEKVRRVERRRKSKRERKNAFNREHNVLHVTLQGVAFAWVGPKIPSIICLF